MWSAVVSSKVSYEGKMAAKKLSFEQVMEQLTDNTDDLGQNEEDEDLLPPEEVMGSKVHDFPEGMNRCSTPYATTMRRILETRISCASVLHSESRLWLAMVNRRLSGRLKIRNPFNGECKRDIPCAVFKALQSALESSSLEEFKAPNCYISENKKAAVISFTSLTTLFTVISRYNEMEARKFYSRYLIKSRGKAELIVNEVKDFALIYKYNNGQFIISFNFAVWNANGFPQHT